MRENGYNGDEKLCYGSDMWNNKVDRMTVVWRDDI